VSQTNTELTRQAYEAINRRDVEWLAARAHPDLEMHMFGVAGVPVVYRGAAGIREWFDDMDELWEWFEAVPEEIRDLGDRVFVLGRQRLGGRASGIEVEEKSALVFRLRDGLLTELRAYPSVEDALAAAGLE
jgi:ketosteroid isomerase-like protein